jgi:hypothetical protein
MDAYFLRELNKFIQTKENHARNKKTQRIPCPCKTCKNMRVFSDTTTIRSYILVGSFVENYKIWTYMVRKHPPLIENPLDKIIEDVEFDRLFDAYDDFCEGGGDYDGVGGCYGDGVGEGTIDGGSDDSSDDKLEDGDFLSQLLRHTKAELLDGSAKGFATFEMVKKSAEENIYGRSKGCPKHWTVLRFILELLTPLPPHQEPALPPPPSPPRARLSHHGAALSSAPPSSTPRHSSVRLSSARASSHRRRLLIELRHHPLSSLHSCGSTSAAPPLLPSARLPRRAALAFLPDPSQAR